MKITPMGYRRNSDVEEKPASVWDPQLRRTFVAALCGASVFLLVSLWLNAAWIYGSLFRQSERAHNLEILLIDLDGGDIGQSLITGAAAVSGTNGIVTFVQTDGMDVDAAYNEVWKGNVWGALIAMPNATARLDAAIGAGDPNYDPSAALQYIWNEARWALAQESVVYASFEAAIAAAQSAYASSYAAERIVAAAGSSSNSNLTTTGALALLEPFSATSVNVYAFAIGIKPFLSTVGFVFPGLIQFFFAMALAGISTKTAFHRHFLAARAYWVRFAVSRLWTLVIALSWSGWFFAFAQGRTGAGAGRGSTYALVTLDMWVYAQIAFEFHDACAAFVPIECLPITVLSWVIVNVTAAAFPAPLKPRFYRVDYALPSYNCFEIFITIVTGGSTNRLYRNLPVLFAWMILTGAVGVAANLRRCRAAAAAAASEKVLQEQTADIASSLEITVGCSGRSASRGLDDPEYEKKGAQ
ncbi:hypothetical protein BX600DRAFT_440478 [Xylariales sp. PMI_506]|nr:hypothetical protein BX600DRAFT_440478 [Xylariales sp. PMI_506]